MESNKYNSSDSIIRTEDEIEKSIDQGHEDPSKMFGSFSGKGKRKQQLEVKKINLDVTLRMLKELDEVANMLNISRQAVIKTYVKEGLDKHFLASSKRSS